MPIDVGDIQIVARTTDVLGEIPLWCERSKALFWVDLLKPAINRYDPALGVSRALPIPEKVGSFCLRRNGGVVITGRSGVAFWDFEREVYQHIANPESDRPNNIMNDGRCDARGRFLFGSMDRMLSGPTGRLWSLNTDGQVALLEDGDIFIPNGLCWSPCGKTMYFGDSRYDQLFAYDYDIDSGQISNKRLFVDTRGIGGTLDGCSVDADGFVWNVRFGNGKIVRFAPNGTIDRVLTMPTLQPTHVTFGGPDLRTLFVTTARFRMKAEALADDTVAGSLIAIETNVQGLSENYFGRW